VSGFECQSSADYLSSHIDLKNLLRSIDALVIMSDIVMPDLIRHPVTEQSEKTLDSGSSPE
jgi:hypothetical protein